MHHRTIFNQNRSNGCRDIAFNVFFQKWRWFAILNLWGKFWDEPQREFDGLYHCAKFGFNHISRFAISIGLAGRSYNSVNNAVLQCDKHIMQCWLVK